MLALCNEVLATIDSNNKDQTPIGQPIFGVGHMMGQFVFYKKGYAPKAELSDEVTANKSVLTRSSEEKILKPLEKEPLSITTFDDLKIHLKTLIQEDLKFALQSYDKVVSHDSREAKNDISCLLYTSPSPRDRG